VLMIALGLNHRFIFNGHDDMLQKVLANENLLKLVMVSCGKVLMGAQNNNNVIDLLVQRGVPINSADEKGMTALHYAVQNFYVYREEQLNLVNKLLDHGANLESKDDKDQTPLMLARAHSQKKTVLGGASVLELLQRRIEEKKPTETKESFLSEQSAGSVSKSGKFATVQYSESKQCQKPDSPKKDPTTKPGPHFRRPGLG